MDSKINEIDNNRPMSRTARNEQLYKQINSSELDSYNVRSNATVIGDQSNNIDVEKIKKILDKRYNETPKRKSIRVEMPEEENNIVFDDTKEYDINTVLEKAKGEQKNSYDDTRGQKIHNTQYNILNQLNIDDSEEKDEKDDDTDEDLMELINTITINETRKNDSHDEEDSDDNEDKDDLDLLDELRGNEDTQVYEGMAEEIERTEITTTKIVEKEPVAEKKKLEKYVDEEEVTREPETIKEKKLDDTKFKTEKRRNKDMIENSFYTEKLFNKKDFVDSDDDFLEDDKLSIGIKILIVLVIVSFLVGVFLFLKSFIGF